MAKEDPANQVNCMNIIYIRAHVDMAYGNAATPVQWTDKMRYDNNIQDYTGCAHPPCWFDLSKYCNGSVSPK